MMNKKGADFVITLLVVLGLAILVFVILAYVFGINVFDVFKRVMPNKANVDDISRNCVIYCSLIDSKYNYCCTQNSVIFKDGDKPRIMDCKSVLAQVSKDCPMNCDGVDCKTPPGVGCKGQARACKDVITGVADVQKGAKCKAQKVFTGGPKDVECVYDSAKGVALATCAEPPSTDVAYKVTTCDALVLGTGNEESKKKICETQVDCHWI